MKIRLLATLLTILFLTGGSGPAFAAVMPSARAVEEAPRMDARQQARIERFQRRLEQKLQKRLERRQAKAAPSAWDDSRLRLGVILVLGALAIALLGAILNAGFFGFIAALVALAGLVLIIWALVEYYG